MPTTRGWAALATGLALWLAARFVGSPDLHMIAAGIVALPAVALVYVHWSQVKLDVRRHMSLIRAYPGTRVTVNLSITNQSRANAPFLLLEDAMPPSLAKPARLVVTGIPAHTERTVAYSIVCRRRGRYTIGPLSVFIADPFGLARIRIENPAESELVVYPEVERVDAWNVAMHGAGSGESALRHLQHSAAEFYTMRQYVTGDDLRRIHWPSVARTGQLMIRQDEATRRSTATVFLDNRVSGLGRDGTVGFERGVSVAATIGKLLATKGYSVRLATIDSPATPVGETRLLELLASVDSVRVSGTGDALVRLRATARSDTSLALVSAPPLPTEVQPILRIGSGFGRKLAVFIYPVNTATVPEHAAAELEARATSARSSLQHAGWEVLILQPDGNLGDVWQSKRNRRPQSVVAPS